MGTYTNKWAIYLPDESETGWGDLMRANLITISEHLGGRLSELGDFNLVDTPQNGDAVKYNATTEQWENCRGHQVGIQNHGELGGLTSDTHGIYLMLDGTLPMGADLDMNFHRIINCQDPLNEGDVVNKRYLSNTTLPFTATQFVISRQVNDPSTIITLEEGDAYIIGSEPVGIWSGHAHALVFWQDAAWTYLSPLKEGKLVYVLNDHEYYRFNGTTWDPLLLPPEHSTLLGLAVGDDHPQYYNELRHHTPSAHPLGDVVPYGELMTLVDTTIEVADLIHGRTLQYIIPPGGVAGTGTWKAVPADNVGHQIHNGLSNRDDIIGGKYIADPSTADYQPALKNHPQYLTDAEHEYDTHAFLSDLYVPWVNLPGVSILSPKGIQIGGNYVFKKPDWDGKLEIASAEQSLDNLVTFPDATGTLMVSRSNTPPIGGIAVYGGKGTYHIINSGPTNTILTGNGDGQPPEWRAITNGGGIQINPDWLSCSGPSNILNKPKEFLFISDVEPIGATEGDIWIDVSDTGLHINRFIVSIIEEGEGNIEPLGMISAPIGSNRNFKLIPAYNQELYSLEIDGNQVPLSGVYQFQNIQENHTISARFRQITSQSAGNVIIAGGISYYPVNNVPLENIEYMTIETMGYTNNYGDLSTYYTSIAGMSDTTHAIVVSGHSNGSYTKMEKIVISQKTNTIDYGSLTSSKVMCGAASNSIRGLCSGGIYQFLDGKAYLNNIEYITFSNSSGSTSFGNLMRGKSNIAGCGSNVRAIWAGGHIDLVNTIEVQALKDIEYSTFATTGNTITFGELSEMGRGGSFAISSEVRSVFGGTTVTSVNQHTINCNNMDYITIATTSNAQIFGNLLSPSSNTSGTSNKVRGVYMGNASGTYPAAWRYIDCITIATTGNSSDFGDMLSCRIHPAVCSNCHGGL